MLNAVAMLVIDVVQSQLTGNSSSFAAVCIRSMAWATMGMRPAARQVVRKLPISGGRQPGGGSGSGTRP